MKEKIIERIKKTSSCFILHGPKGAGKKHLAFDVAKTMLCASENPPCNSCDECKKVDDKNHVNIILVQPRLDPDDKKHKGSNIKIDDVRDFIIEKLPFSPGQKGERFIIIDQAHRLQKESANALLKSLEEPPLHTSFFLLTHNLHSLLPTIISRATVVAVKPIPKQKLIEITGIDAEHPFLNYAKGSVTNLMFYINNEELISELISFIKEPVQDFVKIKELSEGIIDFCLGADDDPIAKATEFENMENITLLIMQVLVEKGDFTKAEELNKMLKKIYLNTNPSIVFENMLLEISNTQNNTGAKYV